MTLNRRNVLFVLASLVLFAVYWQPIRDLVLYAWDFDHTNASQVLLIPFVSGFLIYVNRERIFKTVRFDVLIGAGIACIGIAILVIAQVRGVPAIEGDRLAVAMASLLALWLGLFAAFYGRAAFGAALFPLLFLLFCLPIPKAILDQLISFLQRGSAEISLILLRITGTPVFREDFYFTMPTLTIYIAPECSGIRSFLSMLILTLIAGYMLLETTWRRIALIMVAIPIMIFKNAVRIVTLSLLSIHVDHSIIESRLHKEGGIPFFLLALVLTYPVLKLLMKTERTQMQSSPSLREANL